MSPIRLLLACVALASLPACRERVDIKAEEARLMQTSRDWSRASASGNVDSVLDYWAEDALVIMPDQPPMRGRQAIRAYLEASMKTPGFRIGWEPQEARVSSSGDMGYLVERTTVSVNGPDGRPVESHFRVVTVWRKAPDGSWKNVVDISNAAPAAAPSDFRPPER